MFLASWRCQCSPTGSTSSNPTQDGEETIPVFGEAHQDKSWPLSVGAGEGKQLKQHYPFPSHSEENNPVPPRGRHQDFDSVGSVL